MAAEPNTEQGAPEPQRLPANGSETARDEGDLSAKVEALQKQLGALLNEKKRSAAQQRELAERLKAYESLEADPDTLKALVAQRDEADMQRARDSGEVDKLLANQRQKLERELEAKDGVIKARDRTIEALTLDATLDTEIENLKVKPGLKKAAFALHRPKLKVIADPDAPHGIRTVAEVGGDYMAVTDYLRQWAENDPDAAEFLLANQSTGGGAPGSRGATRGFKARKDMTPKEKSDYINAHGRAAYEALPWDKSSK